MLPEKSSLSELIKAEARKLGFDKAGISKATYLSGKSIILDNWLTENMHGEMDYMARNKDKRLDPRKLVPGAKSVITVLHNYFPECDNLSKGKYRIAKYAYGRDYHMIIKRKLGKLLSFIESLTGKADARIFTDSAPVMDKEWAVRGGLGWIGKNTCLINKHLGSFCFIGHIIINISLSYDKPFKANHCGECSRCIDACPTGALIAPYKLDARRCLSYLTIETRKDIAEEFSGKANGWIFGCDICQDVCPWNRFAKPTNEGAYHPQEELSRMKALDWETLDEKAFESIFEGSAVRRISFGKLKSNIASANVSRKEK